MYANCKHLKFPAVYIWRQFHLDTKITNLNDILRCTQFIFISSFLKFDNNLLPLTSGLEKVFFSLQAGQNFPPAGQISLKCRMVSLMYFFIFSLQITRFPGKELPVLPIFSRPALHPVYMWMKSHLDTR